MTDLRVQGDYAETLREGAGALRVHGDYAETLREGAGALRVQGVFVETLRSTADGVASGAGRRRAARIIGGL